MVPKSGNRFSARSCPSKNRVKDVRMNLMKKTVLALMAAGMLVAVLLETAPV
ncbi:hypothetical protein [Aminobacter carboxidus]|uniref:Uncharacterized protein n=1 Tax=Aminobacter carboxidus TaxID=376165 RepID=A0A8E2BDZ9_9HYPH|nr:MULTISPECIES: hypothetical protein [Aminobacter carboxidus group]MBB6467814.1 hypothetical protein [Aminobacter lissarensis]MBE1206583.1 hypothetical protein [Aminobacter carboxidus]